jgi:K+ transporter
VSDFGRILRTGANACGIAVAGDMLIKSFLVAIVAHGVWKWRALRARARERDS